MALQAVTDRPPGTVRMSNRLTFLSCDIHMTFIYLLHPAALIQLVGRDKHEWGMWMLFMSLQSHKLNKQVSRAYVVPVLRLVSYFCTLCAL